MILSDYKTTGGYELIWTLPTKRFEWHSFGYQVDILITIPRAIVSK